MIPQFKPRAAVEWRPGRGWVVISYSRLPSGVARVNGFVRALPEDADDASLGAAVAEALSHSSEIPDESSLPEKRLHQMLGFRSASTYMKNAKSAMVRLVAPSRVEVEGLENLGSWFSVPTPERITALEVQSPEIIGRAVRMVVDG